MKKTTVYLDEEDLARLRAMAQRERRSPAELIRVAIAQLVGSEPRPLPPGAGAYRSGTSTTTQSRRAILTDATRKPLH